MNTGKFQEKLDTIQAAAYLGISPATLATWRSTKASLIPFYKVGSHVFYLPEDLDAYLTANKKEG